MDFGTICDPVQNVYMYIVNTLLTVILNIGVVPIVHSTHVQNANLQKNSGVFYPTTCHRAYIINVKKSQQIAQLTSILYSSHFAGKRHAYISHSKIRASLSVWFSLV